jgi:hypothetical protein
MARAPQQIVIVKCCKRREFKIQSPLQNLRIYKSRYPPVRDNIHSKLTLRLLRYAFKMAEITYGKLQNCIPSSLLFLGP